MIRRAPVFRQTFALTNPNDSALRVGELSQHEGRWEFMYDPAYLALGAAAWELDPTGIRNKQRAAFIRLGAAPFPVFCDVALSGWSLEALQQRAADFLGPEATRGGEPWGWWERLVYAPVGGFGALFVGDAQHKPDVSGALMRALKSEAKIELGLKRESSSGAMGGERPKIAMFITTFKPWDSNSDGDGGPAEALNVQPVLWKFGLPADPPGAVIAEATALTLAAELGLRVPPHRVRWQADRPALEIERFDLVAGVARSALHCVSAATALDLVPGSDVEDPRRSYVRLRSKLKRPGDAAELFARIVLNAVVGNTDDHPWNTSLRQLGPGDWELSPLYDVMPFFARQGVPTFRMDLTRTRPSRAATRANLLAAGRQIAGLDDEQAWAVVQRTTAHVRAHWRRAFEQHAQARPEARPDAWAKVFEHDWLGLP